MDKLYCGVCQEPVFSDHRFCRNCGSEVMSSVDIEQDIRVRLNQGKQGCLMTSVAKGVLIFIAILALIIFLSNML